MTGAKSGTKKWGMGGPPVFQRKAQEKPHLEDDEDTGEPPVPHLEDDEDTGEPPVPHLEDERIFPPVVFNLSRISDQNTHPASVP